MSNREAAGWEQALKRGAMDKPAFTEDMKRSVLEAVDRPVRKTRQALRFAMIPVVACLAAVLFAVYAPSSAPWNKDQSLTGGGASFPVQYSTLEGGKLVRDMAITSVMPALLPGLDNKVGFLWKADDRSLQTIPLTDVNILDTRKIDGWGVMYTYNLKDDSEFNLFPGQQLGYTGFALDQYTPPGKLHHIGFLDSNSKLFYESEVSTARLFGLETIKLYWNECKLYGSPCTFYLIKENGGLSSYMDITAKVFERDLDGDGIEEAIVIAPQGNEIYLFKEKDEQIEWASVRETLGLGEDDVLGFNDSMNVFVVISSKVTSSQFQTGQMMRVYGHIDNKAEFHELNPEIIDQ